MVPKGRTDKFFLRWINLNSAVDLLYRLWIYLMLSGAHSKIGIVFISLFIFNNFFNCAMNFKSKVNNKTKQINKSIHFLQKITFEALISAIQYKSRKIKK